MTEQKQNVEITIQDLAIIRSIIDAATKGGIFSAKDLSTVGALHDKVNFIVEDYIDKNKEEKTEEA